MLWAAHEAKLPLRRVDHPAERLLGNAIGAPVPIACLNGLIEPFYCQEHTFAVPNTIAAFLHTDEIRHIRF